jgi:hypothetical protein
VTPALKGTEVTVRTGVKIVTNVMSVISVTKASPIPWEDAQRIPACRAGRSVR